MVCLRFWKWAEREVWAKKGLWVKVRRVLGFWSVWFKGSVRVLGFVWVSISGPKGFGLRKG